MRGNPRTTVWALAALCALLPVAAVAADDEVLLLRYAILVGGRESGQGPLAGEARSSGELADLLVEWQPGDDNAEVRELFALEEIGEVVRHVLTLDVGGGESRSTYLHEGVAFAVSFKVDPYGEDAVTARIQVHRNGGLLMAPTVRTALGERAIMSATNGPEAPFLFLVVEVDRVSQASVRQRGLALAWRDDLASPDDEDVTPPLVVDKTPPAYTPEAREARIQGVVILRTVVDEEGRVEVAEVLKGLPLGLTEASIAAVETWRFAPARRAGEPVAVVYNLTINFRLDDDEPAVPSEGPGG